MSTHLSTKQVEDYVERTLPRAEMARADEHINGCEACYRQFLNEFQAWRRFPIEIDLEELAGLKGWHLQGEELKAYVEGRMDELDLDYANLHLQDCAWCREEVDNFSEFTAKLDYYLSKRHSPAKQPSAWNKYHPNLSAVPGDWKPARLGSAAAALILLLLISAAAVWSVLRPKTPGREATVSEPSRKDDSLVVSAPPGTQAAVTARPAQPGSSDTNKRQEQISNPSRNGRQSRSLPSDAAISQAKRKEVRSRQEVEIALPAGDLVLPPVIEVFDRSPVVLRGDDNKGDSFNVISPYSTVIGVDQPTFRWTALSGASSYTVSVYDSDLNLIKTSGPLTGTQWSLPIRLGRGVIHTWIVTALKNGREILAPTLPSRAEFKVIEYSEWVKLIRTVKQAHSGVQRGALYAKAGLLDEAEREFRHYLTLYPADETAKKLLQTVRLWRQP
jgi:hypothetical protein